MPLALFDLDNTLIGGDSDYNWGEFMVERGLVEGKSYQELNKKFYQDYLQGVLNPPAYLKFNLAPLAGRSVAEVTEFHHEFMQSHIQPLWLPKAEQLIEHHRAQGHRLVVITATSRAVTQPIVERFGIHELLCSEPEVVNDCYTGGFVEEPCIGDGKVSKLQRWMQAEGESLEESWFYSDSHNDLPLLRKATYPVAVDPDDHLKSVAVDNGWQVISLR